MVIFRLVAQDRADRHRDFVFFLAAYFTSIIMHASLHTPVGLSERAGILDVLRGFALFGVLLDNLFGFTGWGFYTQPMREALPTWPADGLLGLLELAFINGKFYSLFSLLFGIGFSIILTRHRQKGLNPLPVFYRRLLILALIGAGHLILLWEGDILLLYALLGMLLPFFRHCSDRTLVTWVVVLILSPILLDTVKVLTGFRTGAFLEDLAIRIDTSNGIPADDSWRQYLFREGSGWEEWRNWQASGYIYRYAYLIESNRLPKVLGMFLLGFYAGRKMMISNLEESATLLRRLRKWGFLIGIPAAIALAYFEIDEQSIPKPGGLLDTLSYALSVVPLCLAYTATLCLYWIKRKGQTRWRWLAPMGRMALTNYLMQTIIGISLYYGVGAGLGGNIGPSVFIPAGICVYMVQVWYSNAWFRYFQYGPAEWIWRMLTYRKRLRLRRDS